jgi:hypothetical protein
MVAQAGLPRHPGVASACVDLQPRGRHTVVFTLVSAILCPSTMLSLSGTTPFSLVDDTGVVARSGLSDALRLSR